MNKEKSWVRITHCENIPLREGRAVNACGRKIAIFNLGDRFLAVSNQCPHRNGPLADGIVSGDTIVCPLHAWKFSLETGKGVSSTSASSCIETFRARVEEGVVLVELPAESAVDEELPAACIERSELLAWSASKPPATVQEL
jgi:nitrite reductase (NADH) small subunit